MGLLPPRHTHTEPQQPLLPFSLCLQPVPQDPLQTPHPGLQGPPVQVASTPVSRSRRQGALGARAACPPQQSLDGALHVAGAYTDTRQKKLGPESTLSQQLASGHRGGGGREPHSPQLAVVFQPAGPLGPQSGWLSASQALALVSGVESGLYPKDVPRARGSHIPSVSMQGGQYQTSPVWCPGQTRPFLEPTQNPCPDYQNTIHSFSQKSRAPVRKQL